MRQKLLLKEHTHFNDRHTMVEEADQGDIMEDRLNESEPWEIAFEEGTKMANDEMVDDWEDEEEIV